MKCIPMLSALLLFVTAGDPLADPGHIKISYPPYYDYRGPTVKLDNYSEGLASNDEKVFLATISKMRKEWQDLTAKEMYVAAIRLYDLGYRKESVYWFHSAGYRWEVFYALVDVDKMRNTDGPAEEDDHATGVFYELSRPYFEGYEYCDPEWFAGVIRRVQKEGLVLPDIEKAYPGVAFVDKSKWEKINKDGNEGMDGLLGALGDKEKMEKKKQERIADGTEAAFSKLTSKDLPVP